ncbi:MAG: DUF2254 domain-containing protein [Sphingobacteriales bacterium]|nr:MAG: DUF2254 domain-containing protein [Sphingobacteriales bacterium]
MDWFIYSGNPAGARSILSTIAASMITIAGVAFSINLVTLTLASSQYGPRLLRNFIKDLGNQVVLGTFIATFIYSLIVLLSIRDDEHGFVPQFAVAFAFLLSLLSLALLIYFIHHTSLSIQADSIIKSAYKDLITAIEDFIPRQTITQKEEEPQQTVEMLQRHGYQLTTINAPGTRYVQAIGFSSLARIATEHDLVVELRYKPGDFIVEGEPVADVYYRLVPDTAVLKSLIHCVIMGIQRTPEQEIEFPINQIVEIAIRALSPGINDPHTAITCIHWLGAGLARLAGITLPAELHYDHQGQLRVIRKVHKFEQLVDFAFDTIRYHAAGNVFVSVHIFKALRKVVLQSAENAQIRVLLDMGTVVKRVNEAKLSEPKELEYLDHEYKKLALAASGKVAI